MYHTKLLNKVKIFLLCKPILHVCFSTSGQTIVKKRQSVQKMGQREGFSETDLYKINKLYQCAASEYGEGDGDADEKETTSVRHYSPFRFQILKSI